MLINPESGFMSESEHGRLDSAVVVDGVQMPRTHCLLLLVMLVVASLPAPVVAETARGADATARTQKESPVLLDFRLPSTRGELEGLFASESDSLAVVAFLGVECPLAKLYGPRLQKLADAYRDQGVRFIGVNSNLQDSLEKLRKYQREHRLQFPLVKDAGNVVADAYGATRTAEVFVIDRLLQVRYRGRIDDQYLPGIAKPTAGREDLREALDQLLAGKSVTVPQTEGVGCIIGRVPRQAVATEVTFAKEISRLLQKHCVECHQPGEIGPFALTDYDEVIGWGEMLLEVIDQGRMPPWHGEAGHGEFINARSMTPDEVDLIRNWVRGGMPLGDTAELPPPLVSDFGWQLEREPDQIVAMGKRPYKVPADGVVEYQYFVVDPGFEEDKWVSGVQIQPGNRAVVHHCIVFIRPPDGSPLQGVGWLGGYVPGQKPLPMRPGYAVHVPAGSKLVFQMHYTPVGTPQEDITRIGLIFEEPQNVTHEVFTVIGINQDFEIPPQVPDHAVHGRVRWFPKNGELLGMTPHMHLRGRSFRVEATLGGRETMLLNVPNYDFNWQHFYTYAEPIPLRDVEEIRFTATFDNSPGNPNNPDPTDYVSWGDQTWEEMAIAFFAIARPLQPATDEMPPAVASTAPQAESSESTVSTTDGTTTESAETPMEPPAASSAIEANSASEVSSAADFDARVEQFVDEFFQRFDKNRNGIVERSELPLSLGRFGFWRLSLDGQETLTRDEIRQQARRHLSK